MAPALGGRVLSARYLPATGLGRFVTGLCVAVALRLARL